MAASFITGLALCHLPLLWHKAIISYRTGKRDSENTDLFIQDLRERVIGAPDISTDGFHPYKNAIRDAFNRRASHGVRGTILLPPSVPTVTSPTERLS